MTLDTCYATALFWRDNEINIKFIWTTGAQFRQRQLLRVILYE